MTGQSHQPCWSHGAKKPNWEPRAFVWNFICTGTFRWNRIDIQTSLCVKNNDPVPKWTVMNRQKLINVAAISDMRCETSEVFRSKIPKTVKAKTVRGFSPSTAEIEMPWHFPRSLNHPRKLHKLSLMCEITAFGPCWWTVFLLPKWNTSGYAASSPLLFGSTIFLTACRLPHFFRSQCRTL